MKRYIFIIGSDHRGFHKKQFLSSVLSKKNFDVIDVGASVYKKNDDYVDYAVRVVSEMKKQMKKKNTVVFGVLLCGSGVGMSVVANKFFGIRAALCSNIALARSARHDDDANVLVLPAEHVSRPLSQKIVSAFYETPFSNAARHKRRIRKIFDHEKKCFTSSLPF